ncbi:MAG: SLBB domain-containing protein, partial [Deltaproteobacteria bacterium]|nr:SLBB domain-containing protein [Deltaproteobacteria bacterium]
MHKETIPVMKPIIGYLLLSIILLVPQTGWPQGQNGGVPGGSYGGSYGSMGNSVGTGGSSGLSGNPYGMAPSGAGPYGAAQGSFGSYGMTPSNTVSSGTIPGNVGTYGAARGAYGSILNNPSTLSTVPNVGMPNVGGTYGAASGNAGPYGPPTVTPTIPPTGAMPFAGGLGGSSVNGILPLGNPSASGFGGLNLSPGDIATLLSSPEAQAILNNPTALNSLAQRFGISPNDIQNIRGQLANGSLSQDQLNQLAGRLGGIQASPAEVASIANALGLNPPQIAQLQNAMVARGQQNPNAQNPNQQNPAITSQQGTSLSPQASAVETKFHSLDMPEQMPSAPDLTSLTQFGYSLFSQPVSTFAPVTNVPVGDDYIIGPGDSLVALEWGLLNQSLEMTVDRDGSVQVPGIGPLQVGGLTFAQAKKLLEAQLEQTHGVTANVTMGQLRTIQVFVVGQVNQPGTYTVSSLSRISNVLQQAGGVSKVGSLRYIELKRHNQLINVLDLYDLMLHGDSSHDLRVDNNDVIFVPVIGKVVAVAGDVKVPAIYEVTSTPSINQVLNLAGGVTAFGYAEHLQVERVENHQRTIVLDVNLDQLASRQVAIRDGDLIKIYPVLPQHTNTVTLNGNVHRPGEYQWYSGMRVSNVIQRAQGLLPHTYFSYALIKRTTGPQKYIHYVPVDLGAALSGGEDNQADLLLQQADEIQIFSQDELRDLPHVSVIGEVRSPGDYPLTEKMRLSDLIYQAGGLKDDANRNN